MKTALSRVADRLLPGSAATYGSLPTLLVVLTFVTGVMDAVSYLGLGHVFVANMTGNVIFFAFALTGARNLSVWASVPAIAAFMAGAWGEARLAGTPAGTVRRFRAVAGVQALLVSGAAVAAAARGNHTVLVILLGCGMGLQNAAVRRLAVPDLTTTVLTLTVTGLATDRPGRPTARRLTSIAAMLCGALCGSALTLHAGTAWALILALLLLLAVAAAASAPTERNHS
ncbi:YoaK family protein [Streptomyces sp. NPDC052721]|uniref:YoaK family protein n=1 Tax=Streptomyces sp. NPDC052721 TaxID=3154955 RepID=UPI00341C218C